MTPRTGTSLSILFAPTKRCPRRSTRGERKETDSGKVPSNMRFEDRRDAGKQLARRLEHFADGSTVVLAIPRGGVPVGLEVARSLAVPLDVILVRKLGVPWQSELAFGAIGEEGVKVLNDDIVEATRVSNEEMRHVEEREERELERRARVFRGGGHSVDLEGKVVVIVDDGIATGATARAACSVARARGAARIVLAAPVAPAGWESEFDGFADELVCLYSPAHFAGVGQFYERFPQVTDDEVVRVLADGQGTAMSAVHEERLSIEVPEGSRVEGVLALPREPRGCVVFVHGSGSSRHSPRNRQVASMLTSAGFATVLFDLLTPQEEYDRGNVFDIDMLSRRLGLVIDVVSERQDLRGSSIGLFGASTGAAAALAYAARSHDRIAAVVSRGGRPDLASEVLGDVSCPVLLIVGSLDEYVLSLNESARRRLGHHGRLVVVPGASHLFEEAGTLQMAGAEATQFFLEHLTKQRVGSSRAR